MVGAMVVVIAIMMFAARFMRGRVGITRGPVKGTDVEVVARHSLSRNASLVTSRIGDRYFVLGVTDHNIQTITELDALDLEDDGLDVDWTTHLGNETSTSQSSTTRKGMIEQLREMTARRA